MISEVASNVARSQSLCVLTGSGISAESGLPTFRGVGGLWKTHRVEELASPAGFARDPELVWSWYNERRAAHGLVEPNAGHYALARLEREFDDFTLATQNVDSLHLRAGSQAVLELHGSLREARCERCGARRQFDAPLAPEEIQHGCDVAGSGRFRPDIVWFGEPLPQATWAAAAEAAGRADTVIVIGTSGMVNPAVLLATRIPRPDAYVVEVNVEPTVLTPYASAHLAGPAASVLPELVDAITTLRKNTEPT